MPRARRLESFNAPLRVDDRWEILNLAHAANGAKSNDAHRSNDLLAQLNDARYGAAQRSWIMQRFLASGTAAVLLAAASACSHQVVIDSNPPGANIRINGELVGEAPVTYNETTGWDKSYRLEASKPGYRTTKKTLTQNKWNTPVLVASIGGAAVFGITGCGLLSLAGLLFSKQLPDEVVVELVSENDVSDADPPAALGPPVAQLAY